VLEVSIPAHTSSTGLGFALFIEGQTASLAGRLLAFARTHEQAFGWSAQPGAGATSVSV
jgi:hypothetical protein